MRRETGRDDALDVALMAASLLSIGKLNAQLVSEVIDMDQTTINALAHTRLQVVAQTSLIFSTSALLKSGFSIIGTCAAAARALRTLLG